MDLQRSHSSVYVRLLPSGGGPCDHVIGLSKRVRKIVNQRKLIIQ